VNQPSRFVDAGYWIAVINTADALHERARALGDVLQNQLVTTDVVIIEVANTLTASHS